METTLPKKNGKKKALQGKHVGKEKGDDLGRAPLSSITKTAMLSRS